MFESLTNELCLASDLTPGAATNGHHQAGVDGRWYGHDNTQVTLIRKPNLVNVLFPTDLVHLRIWDIPNSEFHST